MKYKAVIFDLGGTLVRSPGRSDYADTTRKMASTLNAPVEEFTRLWFEHGEDLGKGVFTGHEALIRHVCAQLGVNTEDHLVIAAANIPYNLTKQAITVPRDDAMNVLKQLKLNGYKTGLISDCTPAVPEIWNETPFADFIDVAIFSCYVGMNKADTQIFRLAIKELAVKSRDCVYVADGIRRELANASKLGMFAIQIRVPAEIDDNPLRENWHGPIISSLKEVLDLVK
jgi:putative hydrolase of the HAD superfamily